MTIDLLSAVVLSVMTIGIIVILVLMPGLKRANEELTAKNRAQEKEHEEFMKQFDFT